MIIPLQYYTDFLLRGVFTPGCHSNLLHEASGFMGSGLSGFSFIFAFLRHNFAPFTFSKSTTYQELVPSIKSIRLKRLYLCPIIADVLHRTEFEYFQSKMTNIQEQFVNVFVKYGHILAGDSVTQKEKKELQIELKRLLRV